MTKIKQRSVVLALFFSTITFGLYFLYWFAKLSREVAETVGETVHRGGALTVVASLFSGNLFGCYWFYKVPFKLNELREAAGLKASEVSKGIWVFSIFVFTQFYSISTFFYMLRDKEVREQIAALNWETEEGIVEAIVFFLVFAVVAWIGSMVVFSIPAIITLCCYQSKPKIVYSVSMFFCAVVAVAVLQANLNNYLLYLSRKEKGAFSGLPHPTGEKEIAIQ